MKAYGLTVLILAIFMAVAGTSNASHNALTNNVTCPRDWIKCSDGQTCIKENWKCDGFPNCVDGSDELDCHISKEVQRNTKVIQARTKLINWFLKRRKSGSSINKWGEDLHRIATSLYLADKNFFIPGNKTGEEMAYELTIQLLRKLPGQEYLNKRMKTIRTQELAMYIHALMVTCVDPKHFFGHDLVSELRGSIQDSNYTNPFAILVLCNAGNTMTAKDVGKIINTFASPHRPFWTDTQAVAFMALQCISIHSNVSVDARILKEMQQELKKKQLKNGTVDNPITTALVTQSLFRIGTKEQNLNMMSAVNVLLEHQNTDGSWGSIQNSYHVLPVLSSTSILSINMKHCIKSPQNEEDVMKNQLNRGEKFMVQYSVWIGKDPDLIRTWKIMMVENKTFYDVIETIRKLDSRHNVTYYMIENKPYVSSLYGKQDDSELGIYWLTYVKSLLTKSPPKLIKGSPLDVKVLPNQEFILWYKPGEWDANSLKGKINLFEKTNSLQAF